MMKVEATSMPAVKKNTQIQSVTGRGAPVRRPTPLSLKRHRPASRQSHARGHSEHHSRFMKFQQVEIHKRSGAETA
eukprot:315726-Pleurochrysis_carterae.AAC.1